MGMSWELVVASGIDIHSWSFGLVTKVSDLYEPRVWGPSRDLECECGTWRGVASVGRLCIECGVVVTSDALRTRKMRLGHIKLPLPCQDPFGVSIIEAFPVAPIAYRVDDAGCVNGLGRKYEELVNLFASMPSLEGTQAYYEKLADPTAGAPIRNSLYDLLGFNGSGEAPGLSEVPKDSLLAALFTSFVQLDGGTAALIRAFGCAIQLAGSI